MTLGVVIPCYRQERLLATTVTALERALAGREWRGAVVLSVASRDALPGLGGHWRLIPPPSRAAVTPGASRMIGCEAVEGDWVLFGDADVEVDPRWWARAEELAKGEGKLAGIGGRLEEWMTDGHRQWKGSEDLVRVGEAERSVEFLTTPVLYRRSALLAVGGYDPRLNSEEDFELGMRLRAAGFELRTLDVLAGRHWSGPRPSFSEMARRWRSGLCFGMGQVLRLYLGRPGFARLLARQWLYLATLAMWGLALAGLLVGVVRQEPAVVGAGLVPLVAAWLLMTLRKRSQRLGLHSVLSWTVNGAGMLVGFFRLPSSLGGRAGLGGAR